MDADMKKRLRHHEDMYLRRLFGMLAQMAKADGKVDAWEVHAAEGAFARFPRAAERRRFCVGVFNKAKSGRIDIARMANEFAYKWASPDDCLAVYELLWDVACATGVLRAEQKRLLREICPFLRLPPAYFDIYYRRRRSTFREQEQKQFEGNRSQQSRHTSEKQRSQRREENRRERPKPPPKPNSALQRAYELLGCKESDSNDVVKRSYRLAAKKYHPDMLRAAGASEAQVKQSTQKMAQVNAAWELIRKKRGL